MAPGQELRVVIVKPSKYGVDGSVERFRWGFMPNATVCYLASLTPQRVGDMACAVRSIDEYVQTDLEYLKLFEPSPGTRTLIALVGVQSHQFQRALDLAAHAVTRGCLAVIGGPHPMTCDTREAQGRGPAFALSEAELVWQGILEDATRGELAPVYGGDQRWQARLESPVVSPPPRRELRRYVVPLLGVYPARGCPYSCNFCSVIKIAGHAIRSQPIATTIATLRAAKAGGVRIVMFTSDNFNKYPDAVGLLEAMIEEGIRLPFFVQCDAMIERQPEFVELLARAGCFQIFVGAESFSVEALRGVHKFHNTPARYAEIVRLCREHRISSHFSNILGFPSDTEDSIREHVETLRRLSPDVASFYILTPIPGTEQYDDFLAKGWITERNLDRFDGTTATWRHPNLSSERLADLLFDSYRGFYDWAHIAKRVARVGRSSKDFRTGETLFAMAGAAVQARLAARRRTHPMAGGVGRVRIDRAEDY
ncbi:MAG: radical SAM protein, partial [Thermoanaerobaculia bacterium]